jgi:hypothetical protein
MKKNRIALALLLGGVFSIPCLEPVQAQPPGFSPWGGGGGPPMGPGGPMGGPPPWGGGDYSSRWGRGSDGRSGFDPSMFLSRMDSNGNGMLDPEEAQGPARFMLDRLARDNPKIDISKPIPMSTLTDAFQRMRGGDSSYRGSDSSSDEFVLSNEKTSLVQGFASATKVEKQKVPGFGMSSEEPTIQIEEQDLREAEERIKRYDRNNDEILDENEIKEGRWSDSPLVYDKNKDGKLTKQELAVRQAKRRLSGGSSYGSSYGSSSSSSSSSYGSSDASRRDSSSGSSSKRRDRGDSGDDRKEKPNPFEKIPSYRLGDKDGKPTRPAGLPEWFIRNDSNSDNQISMGEATRKWTEDAVEDFAKFDTDLDGYITTKECLAGVKKGHIPNFTSGASSGSSSSASAPTSPATATSSTTAKATPTPSSAASPASAEAERMLAWSETKLKKLDKDGNNTLSPDEFKEGDFAAVDTNKDGRVDVREYAAFRSKK